MAASLTDILLGLLAFACCAAIWTARRGSTAGVADSVDAATARLRSAADGDLLTPTPANVGERLPDLSEALDGLFRKVRVKLESANALALFDPVTGLANRTSFRREAEATIAQLPDDVSSALIFIDLDQFKAVNDTLGHAQGDKLLTMVGKRLLAVMHDEVAGYGPEAVVGRLAGDEFTILLPQAGNEATVAAIADKLLATLTEPFDLTGHRVEVGASMGIAMRPAHGVTLTTLMRAADVAMYHAKELGRGQYQYYSDALAEQVAERAQLENDLGAAVERKELAMMFQPLISLATGEVIAAEALLRWNHPVHGLRLPGSFIRAAEESGLIYALGDWAMNSVFKSLARWPSLGIQSRMSVNLSPRQITRADFFPNLRAALTRYGIAIDRVELEIGETVAMNCGDAVIKEIAALRAQGATVAIDDFGAGYSNLIRLKSLPIDHIKIDRSLIAGIDGDAAARSMVQAVIGLIHSLGCQAIAEGVESDAQIDVLRVMGCDMVQGYAIAKPMAEADYVDWTKTRARMRA